MLSRVGEKLQAETKRTIDICYNQIQSLLSHDIKEVRRQYWMFARQLHDRNAKLCAAGFLYIDHSLILYFATIVCVKNNFWFYKQITYTASEDTKDWNKFFKIYKLLLKKTLRPVNSYFSLHIFALNVIDLKVNFYKICHKNDLVTPYYRLKCYQKFTKCLRFKLISIGYLLH